MHARSTERRCAAAVVVAALWLALTAGLAPMAAAQEGDDPYGPTTTTRPPASGGVECEVQIEVTGPATQVTSWVTGPVAGDDVRLLLGGHEVARGTAPASGQTSAVDLELDVPAVDPVPRVFAVTPSVTVECEIGGDLVALASRPDQGVRVQLLIGDDLVLGDDGALDGEADPGDQGGGGPGTEATDPTGAGSGPGGSGRDGSGPGGSGPAVAGSEVAESPAAGGTGGSSSIGLLPRTGATVALLVAVALALLVAGRALLAGSRHRHRHRRHRSSRHPAGV